MSRSTSPGRPPSQGEFPAHSQPPAALPAGPFAWGLTEGAAGMVSQVRGLAQALEGTYDIIDCRVRFPWKRVWPALVPLRSTIFANPAPLSAPPPRVAISCGKQGAMASLYLKRLYGPDLLTVHLQDPRLDTRRFDLVVAPEHDGLRGPNVHSTRGAMHHVNARVLAAAARSPAAAPFHTGHHPCVAVLLGGPNTCYRFTAETLKPLVAQLRMLVRRDNAKLAILPSRRTPPDVVDLFQKWFAPNHIVWTGEGDNPYLPALALCTHLVVTGDSVSMISEAAATQKPVFVYPLPETRRSRRFHRFHATFAEAGITRPFAGKLESWTYNSPNTTDEIARLILDRLGAPHAAAARPAA